MRGTIFTIFLLLILQGEVFAQNKSTDSLFGKFFKTPIAIKLLNSITGNAESMIDTNRVVIANNIELLTKYSGKEINSIVIEQHNFSTNINLPLINQKDYFTKIANQLHSSSDDETIRRNLFFKPGENLNPTIIAYNEKWLRDLPFLQDARIIVNPLKYDSNKIDLTIITKDIFPYGATFNLKNANAYEASISNESILGSGNALQINHNYDKTRSPNIGLGFDAQLRNISGKFININAGINDLTSNTIDGSASAMKHYISGELPLLHPFSVWTGGFELIDIKNKNAFPGNWNDSLYNNKMNYHLNNIDLWLGYQLFLYKNNKTINGNRHIVQIRHVNNNFITRPVDYLNILDKNFQNLSANFASYTIFNQKIIRTRYLYGFGRNEDLPIGQSISLTLGQYSKELEKLGYAGLQMEKYSLRPSGAFTHLNINMGSSFFNSQFQDIRFLTSMEVISKLKYHGNGLAYRKIFNFSLAQTLKNKYNEALLLYSNFGIPQLNKEHMRGSTRLSGNWESVWYPTKSFYGFKSSPFLFANMTYMRSLDESNIESNIYTAVGGGARIRNENLIFGTIEMKCYYLPRTDQQLNRWNFSIITNLRFKYNSKIINKPDFVTIN